MDTKALEQWLRARKQDAIFRSDETNAAIDMICDRLLAFDAMEEALKNLHNTASRFHDEASRYISDRDYDENGCLAEAEAKLEVVCFPEARAALAWRSANRSTS